MITNITGIKRTRSEDLEQSSRQVEAYEIIKASAVTVKLRDILTTPSKHLKEELRSALDYISYDVKFLMLVANELKVDILAVTSRSRTTRAQIMEYLIHMLIE